MSEHRYIHGHHSSVLRSHLWRTAQNSAGYVLDRLSPGQDLLDVGCGPGTITVELGARVAPGRTVGVDLSPDVIGRARAAWNTGSVTFHCADVYALPYPDGSFDVVHAHQVLQHLDRPIEALREMRRVLRRGGVVAVRDADHGAFMWAPADPELERWMSIYREIARHNGAEPDAGRHLASWVRAAGFCDATVTSSTWTFADPPRRQWWGELWADRVRYSALADQAIALGLTDRDGLERVAAAFVSWADQPDGLYVIPHIEVVAGRADEEGAGKT